MDADIKALENEVAKINPPPHPPHTIQPPTVPPPNPSNPSTKYTSSRAPNPIKPPLQFHPYTKPPPAPNPISTTAIIHQQIAARSAIAQATQIQAAAAARLQAQAAAITAARTRTLMSAAAQAQAARAAAIARANTAKNMISSGPKPNTNTTHSNTNSHSHNFPTIKPTEHGNVNVNNHGHNHNHNHHQQASVGPSYTKNNATNTYNKYGKLGYHRGTNYKRYEYDYTKKMTATTIPNSSLRNHGMSAHDGYGVHGTKPPKKKKLKATHQYQLRTAANEKWVDPTMTDWPENDFRIFCGDLGNEVSDAMLTSAFSKYPSFAKAKVVRDKRTGKSKGYGFVSFLEPHDFIRAFKEMNGKYVGNRPIKLRRSKWKERMKKVKNFKIRE